MKKLCFCIALLLPCLNFAQTLYVTGNHHICPGDELTLFAGGDTSYAWAISTDPDSILSHDNYIVLEPRMNDTVILYTTSDTIYTAVWNNPYQCDYHCYVPNIFTPDANEFNETLCPLVTGKDILGARLTICNRGGKIVFDETALHPPCWDGKHPDSGQLLQNGVYVYFFSFITEDNTTIRKNGFIVLGK